MLEKHLLEELLGIAVSTGADFAEVFAQEERSGQLRLISGKIESVRDNLLSGVGIRAFVGTKTYYASTSDTSREGLLRCAAAVAGAVGDASGQMTLVNLTPDAITVERVAHLPGDVATARKADILREAADAASGCDERITQVQGVYMDVDRRFLVANTEGLCREDRKVRTRLAMTAVASKDGENQSGFYGPGGGMGYRYAPFFMTFVCQFVVSLGPSCNSSAYSFIAAMQIAATSLTSIPSISQPLRITSRSHFAANFLSLNFFIKLDTSISVMPKGRIRAAA